MDFQTKKMDYSMQEFVSNGSMFRMNRDPAKAEMENLRLPEGFPGQIMHVLPRPTLDTMGQHLLLRSLCVTDIGWYPHARHHFRRRPNGADQHILILCVGGTGWYEIEGKRSELLPEMFW